MAADPLPPLPSLEPLVLAARSGITQAVDVAIVGPPGCGATTTGERIVRDLGRPIATIDCRHSMSLDEQTTAILLQAPACAAILIEHAADLADGDFSRLTAQLARLGERTHLWTGSLDARRLRETHGLLIHSQPRTHLCFPELSRDELL